MKKAYLRLISYIGVAMLAAFLAVQGYDAAEYLYWLVRGELPGEPVNIQAFAVVISLVALLSLPLLVRWLIKKAPRILRDMREVVSGDVNNACEIIRISDELLRKPKPHSPSKIMKIFGGPKAM